MLAVCVQLRITESAEECVVTWTVLGEGLRLQIQILACRISHVVTFHLSFEISIFSLDRISIADSGRTGDGRGS